MSFESALFAFHQPTDGITAPLAFALQYQVAAFDATGDVEHACGFTAVAAQDRIQNHKPVFGRYCRPELLGRWGKVTQWGTNLFADEGEGERIT